ncbi:hypothetical protein V1515DRAFT_641283 [Lipomyces mesembrius]
MSERKDNVVAEVALISSSSQPSQKAKPTAPVSAWNVLVQGIALFSDGLCASYGIYANSRGKAHQTRLSNSILVGEVIGMLLFGLCIDRFGRRVGIIATTAFLILVWESYFQLINTVTGMFLMMILSRGVAGVGAGGEYAVCTAQALESADSSASLQKRRGFLVTISTNLAIVSGFVGSSIVSLIVIAAYGNKASEGIWRVCFGIGIFTIFFVRMSLLDSNQYQKHAIQRRSVGWNRIGGRQTYTVGWAIVFVLGFLIGGLRFFLSHVFPLFVVLYGFFQSFLSAGPGDCNFLVSSESFPTPLRGHFLGFAAAVGKAGSAIGTTVLTIALNSFQNPTNGQQVLFFIGSSISHPATLEEEDLKFRAYLEENGYDTSEMGLVGKH